jgi:DNA primase
MALIPNDIIDEIKNRANIVDVIGRSIQLKRSGTNFSAVCPFHKENTPSFMVSPQKQIFHCFGCHVGGNVFSFVMEYDKLSFVEAVRKIAADTGFDMSKVKLVASKSNDKRDLYYETNESAAQFFQAALSADQPAQAYFASRHVSAEIQQKFRLGYAPTTWDALCKHIQPDHIPLAIELGLCIKKDRIYDRFRQRLIYPIFDVNGHIVGFGGRRINEEQTPKYLNSPESAIYNKSYVLYGLNYALNGIRQEKSCIFVEGYMDVLRCHQFGIENVVATSGTALTTAHARLISRYCKKVYLIFDSDEAGLQAMIRSIPILLGQSLDLFIVPIPKGHDPDSVLLKYGREKFEELLALSVDYIDFQYRFYHKRGDFKQNTTKSTIIKQMIDHTNAIPDDFLRSLNKSRIAKLFDMEVDMVQSYHVQQFISNENVTEENQLQLMFSRINDDRYFQEREILMLLFILEEQEQLGLIHELRPSYFKNDLLKKLITDIQNIVDDEGRLILEQLTALTENGFYQAFIEQAQLKSYENLDEHLDAILFKLKIKSINEQIRNLKNTKELDNQGFETIARLQKEKLQLKEQRKNNAT